MFNKPNSLRPFLLSSLFMLLLSMNTSVIMANDAEIDAAKNAQLGFKTSAKKVLAVMNTWARAWAQLDAPTYISSYAPGYIGKGFPSHFTWAANRQQRLGKQKSIKLSLSDIEIFSTKPGLFSVSFTQDYKSDTYKDLTRKQLDFKKHDDNWYIVAEKTLPGKAASKK